MNLEQLKKKALSLPSEPGVYLMKDANDNVIYVGKAKKLKNRVSQYFQDTASHALKTKQMVSNVDHFDVIVAASEFEALVLECAQIKQYMPKYNILLKDGKGYPYIRLDMRECYPAVALVNKPSDDGAVYYGPFGSRGVTNSILEGIKFSLKLPSCTKKFPRDIGKERPCLHYHMGQCSGWCKSDKTQNEYRLVAEQAKQLLSGNYKQVVEQLRDEMIEASENMNFELAANLRDRAAAIEMLGRKQFVTAGRNRNTDVVGFAMTETKACFVVLHYSDGDLIDKDYEVFSAPDDSAAAISSLLKQYYLNRGFAPQFVLLPFEIDDCALFEELLFQNYGKRTLFKVPQRGDNVKLISLAQKNAIEEAERVTLSDERVRAAVSLLGKMLAIEVPLRIESFDISNISGTDIVASMVVFCDGRPKRSAYKHFKIEDMPGQDDYASMRQVVMRRFRHLKQNDAGFEVMPNLLLIDGGVNHAAVAVDVLRELGIDLPVFGMVKDHKHRTRALVTAQGDEIGIESQQSVFALIGNIQEETHRFAISYHRKLRSKRLQYSELDEIPGVGPKRKQDLLKSFKSIKAIKKAKMSDLERCLPAKVAEAVYNYFNSEKKGIE